MDLKVLEEISRSAAKESAITLSRMLGAPIAISIHSISSAKDFEMSSLVKETTLPLVVSHELTGEVSGRISFILPQEAAIEFSNLLLKRERGATTEFSSEVKDVMEELSNVVIGKYLSAFSRQWGLKNLVHKVGSSRFEPIQTIEEGLPRHSTSPTDTALVAILFGLQETVVRGYVLILLNVDK